MNTLARQLRATDYFTLGWGTMVGVGWLVIMDDWLLRGGALGAFLGFVIGGALLLPIGWVYGKLVIAMPDAAGEIAYTSAVFSRPASFATGWMMTLAYFIVCPWEAVAVGRIAGYIIPGLDSMELYRIAGRPVYLPHLVIGLALTALLTILNYRGIRLSATFQNWTSFGTLALFVVFVALGVSRGSPANIQPLFTHTPLISILLVIQIVPYFMTGFESVGKAAEEASPDFRARGFFRAIWMAIFIGILFYASHRRSSRIRRSLAPADRREIHDRRRLPASAGLALDREYHSRRRVALALQMLQRKLRRRQPPVLCAGTPRHGRFRVLEPSTPRYHTPSTAVLCVGLATAACMLLGDAILVPVTEVGSVACAIGWSATCAACLALARSRPAVMSLSFTERAVAWFGLAVGIAMALMKLIPLVPGHFTMYEWLALGIWIVLGTTLQRTGKGTTSMGP